MDRGRMAPLREQPARQVLPPHARGRQQLKLETASWSAFVQAVGKVLHATGQPG